MLDKINVILCITSYNFLSGDYMILTNFHGSLPQKSSDLSAQPEDLVRSVGKDVTGLDDNWLNYKIRKCYMKDNELFVVYSICIPLDTIEDDGRYLWKDVTLFESENENVTVAVGEAIKEIV